MSKLSRGGHGEYLRLHLRAQIQHHTNHVDAIDADAHRLNVGIVRANLEGEFPQGRAKFDIFNVDDQPFRVFDKKVPDLECHWRLKSNTGVFVGRPDASGGNFGGSFGIPRHQRRHDERKRKKCSTGEIRICAAFNRYFVDMSGVWLFFSTANIS